MTKAPQAQTLDGHSCSAVPAEVFDTVNDALLSCERVNVRATRDEVARRIAPLMAAQGWRFCKCYRQGQTAAHSLIYQVVSTIDANFLADDLPVAQASPNA